MARAVVIQHRGDRNVGLALGGAGALVLGLLLITASPALAGLLVLGGFIAFMIGIKPRTYPCPRCRARISKRAMVCPQCQSNNPWSLAA